MPIKNSKIHKSVSIINDKLVNIYGCVVGRNTKIGPFVEIQKDVSIGKNCKISSHTFICTGVIIKDVKEFKGKKDCMMLEINNEPLHYIWVPNEGSRGKMFYHIKNMRETPHKFLRNS